MLKTCGRVVGIVAVGGAALIAGAAPASAAANPTSNCIGTAASALGPGGNLDIAMFQKLAEEDLLFKNLGVLVRGNAQRQGGLDECLTPPAPMP